MSRSSIERTPSLFSETAEESAAEPRGHDPALMALQTHAAMEAERARDVARRRERQIDRPQGFDHKNGIKSRERVQSMAEVLTAEREVKAMLDLVDETARNPRTRVLEPACGNGNFLEEILARKLSTVTASASSQNEFEFEVLVALSNTYGIDINEENVNEARSRLRSLVVHAYSTTRNTSRPRNGFYESVDYILTTNIVLGDSWQNADQIIVVEYTTPFADRFTRRFFHLAELERRNRQLQQVPKPFKVLAATHFLELAHAA